MGRFTHLQEKAVALRRSGKTYQEIQSELGYIPKATLTFWCKGIQLPQAVLLQQKKSAAEHLQRIRILAAGKKQQQRLLFHVEQLNSNKELPRLLKNKATAKIALSSLYLCHGTQSGGSRNSVSFGTSDAALIKLFLHLLRLCFRIDETKFRCTIQCRAGQDIRKLEESWARVTGIPHAQFYTARIDPRSVRKAEADPEYKGVCRIDYLSVRVFEEIVLIGKLLTKGL